MLDDGRKVTVELFREVAATRSSTALASARSATQAYDAGNYRARRARCSTDITTAPASSRRFSPCRPIERLQLNHESSHDDESHRRSRLAKTGKRTRAGRACSAPTRPRTSCACAARVHVEHSLARLGAEKLWRYVNEKPFVNALGALTGNQAMQQVEGRAQGDLSVAAGRWRATPTSRARCIPTSPCIPPTRVPAVVRRINNTLLRADQIHHAEGNDSIDWFKPIVADAEAGFGGVLNAFELMKGMIEAGAAGVHFEDQLSSAKKCGHMGGKVLVPTQEAINKLVAARLAADVCGVPTVLVARTDAESAQPAHHRRRRARPAVHHSKERTAEGFFHVKAGLEQAIARGLAYAPYADLIWCETGDAGPATRRSSSPRRSTRSSRQAAGLQLLAVVQLEEEARRRDDREVPARARRDGLQVPVHHAGRLPRAQLLDVRAGARLQGVADDGVRAAAAAGVRGREGRLHGDQAPARSRRRLLRRSDADGHGGQSSITAMRARPRKRSSQGARVSERRRG